MSTSVSRGPEGFVYSPSVGGLATGLSSLHEQENSLWIGWSGLPSDTLTQDERTRIADRLKNEFKSIPVDLTSEDMELFYYGFCNNVLWPLFHYFPTYVDYNDAFWESYRDVNNRFFESVKDHIRENDVVWVHDYQLLLLPALIKQHQPEARVGFFLHIPFPSFELFRLLPWRRPILEGMLGADLLGFHTYDYARHFLSSVRRLLGYDHDLATIQYKSRAVKVDVFPMGIDYARYSEAPGRKEIQEYAEEIRREYKGQKVILSVDRLDYSKGIPQRIRGFMRFLEKCPQQREKVSLVIIVAPSRTEVPQYKELKREIDELVSIINGRFATVTWTPIRYFYRAMPFERLSALYDQSDVLLVTPLRDGMNLIAKEFVAAKRDKPAVVVISETAGAARELSEALLVNASSVDDIADAIREALEMPREEQLARTARMQRRLERYDVHYWARDFMEKLAGAIEHQQSFLAKRLAGGARTKLLASYAKAKRRLLVLDYDGTLIPYHDAPDRAVPDAALKRTITTLCNDPRNDVVIVSSRDRAFLDRHLGDLSVGLVASHGTWTRSSSGEWRELLPVDTEWKQTIAPIMQLHAQRTPSSRFEEKEYSLAWHYQRSEPDLAFVRVAELRDALLTITTNFDLTTFEGPRVIEVKSTLASKAQAVMNWLESGDYDFILAAGDDRTDEELFAALPEDAHSIRIRLAPSSAHYFLDSDDELRALLEEFAEESA
jgi:trehalose 6-phosphate synthase/phosphatase